MEVWTFSNVFDDVFEDFKSRKVASEEINIEGGDIVMRCDGVKYEIPLDDCETVSGALKWLHHMSEKTWVTEARLWRIAECMIYNENKEENPW